MSKPSERIKEIYKDRESPNLFEPIMLYLDEEYENKEKRGVVVVLDKNDQPIS